MVVESKPIPSPAEICQALRDLVREICEEYDLPALGGGFDALPGFDRVKDFRCVL